MESILVAVLGRCGLLGGVEMQVIAVGLYGAGMVAQFCDYITYHYLYT